VLSGCVASSLSTTSHKAFMDRRLLVGRHENLADKRLGRFCILKTLPENPGFKEQSLRLIRTPPDDQVDHARQF
jgi:hypothetical protein